MASLYRLNPGDRAIFEAANEDPNYFTEFYFKGKATGTYWRKITETSSIPEIDAIIQRWQLGYDILYEKWMKLNKPGIFEHDDVVYIVIFDNSESPTFFNHHGTVVLDWWKEYWSAKQKTRVCIGGYGSAKTWMEMCRNLKKMATTPYYRCFVIAPFSIQATEVLTQAKRLLTGTEYQKRFMDDRGFRSRPNPAIIVRNDLCGESIMEFFSIEKNADKLLNLSGDAFHVEQAEQVDNLDGLLEIIGSRLRGQVAGLELEGIITFIANSDEGGNPQLWDYFDEAETDPDSVLATQPWIFDNPYITPNQLIEIAKRISRQGVQNLDRALKGARPKGSGEHFPRESIEKCHSETLDEMMEIELKKENTKAILRTMPKAQVVEWSLPPEKDHIYLQAADPGYANPPARNSAAIMVFDITYFPEVPASLRAFYWVYGENSPDPWIMKYLEYCHTYGCIGRNGFDATGPQSGYGHFVHGLHMLNPWEVKMGGGTKYIYLNAAKTLMSRGKFAFPNIPMLFAQLSKYKLPDDKLRQDLVATLTVAAAQLDWMFFGADDGIVDFKKNEDGRYQFHSRERDHQRR